MKKEYIKIASIPEGEIVVSAIEWNSNKIYWDFKYPFRHKISSNYIIATQKSVYLLNISNIINNKDD